MFSKIKDALLILGILALCTMSFFAGRKSGYTPEVATETKYDTIHIEKPVPSLPDSIRTEYVYIQLPPDTVYIDRDNTVIQTDSVKIPINVERRVYEDPRYRAVVSGITIGDIHPSLDEIDIYNMTETRIIEHKSPILRPYVRGVIGRDVVGIGGGVSIKDRVDVDIQYMRIGNSNMVVVGANYRFNIKCK